MSAYLKSSVRRKIYAMPFQIHWYSLYTTLSFMERNPVRKSVKYCTGFSPRRLDTIRHRGGCIPKSISSIIDTKAALYSRRMHQHFFRLGLSSFFSMVDTVKYRSKLNRLRRKQSKCPLRISLRWIAAGKCNDMCLQLPWLPSQEQAVFHVSSYWS